MHLKNIIYIFLWTCSGYKRKLKNHVECYVTNTFCYGYNLDPTQTARSIQEIQYIITAHNHSELLKFWGDGTI